MARRSQTPPEIPLASTADVAFLLLVFFLVAASAGDDRGRNLDLPGIEKNQEQKSEVENFEIKVLPNTIQFNNEELEPDVDLVAFLHEKLEGRTTPEDRVIMMFSDGQVTYQRWNDVFDAIEKAGGIPAPQIEEASGGGGGGEE